MAVGFELRHDAAGTKTIYLGPNPRPVCAASRNDINNDFLIIILVPAIRAGQVRRGLVRPVNDCPT